jgi:plastocyanin
MIRVFSFVLVASLSLSLFACGSDNNPAAPTPAPSPAPAPAPAPAPSGATVTIGSGATTQGTNAFGMAPLTIATGTTVTFRNNDSVVHTATSDAAGVFNTGNISANGGTGTVTFATAGTMRYHCAIHPGMMGSIVVQ